MERILDWWVCYFKCNPPHLYGVGQGRVVTFHSLPYPATTTITTIINSLILVISGMFRCGGETSKSVKEVLPGPLLVVER